MGKPRIIGRAKPAPACGQYNMDRMWQRKLQKQRNRESTTRKPVPAQIAKEKKEAQE